MDTTRKTKRLMWLDIAKGIACLLVIVGHTVSLESPLRHYIFSFHMPLFFILAGFTFRPKPWREIVPSSVKRLLLPYLLVFIIWDGRQLLATPEAFSPQTLYSYAMMFLFASGTDVVPFGYPAVGMIWFLAALFASRMIMNALARLADDKGLPFSVLGILCTITGTIGYGIGSIAHIDLPLSLDVSMVAVFFMWCGMAFRKLGDIDAFCRPSLFAAAIIIWLVSTHFSYLELAARRFDMLPLALIGALGGTLVTCIFSRIVERAGRRGPLAPVSTFFAFSGKYSMSIFCIHAMDWWIPWTTLPALSGLPFPNGFASLARIVYSTVFARLIKALA